ncbi:hypothetical protein WJX77_000222 [Trebouxia sp. C0004]
MFMNISNVKFERDGSSTHNIAPEALAPETLVQENGHVDTLKALSTSTLETAVYGSSAEPEQAVSEELRANDSDTSEAQQLSSPDQLGHNNAQNPANSANSPSPSFDSLGSAGQTEADSNSGGPKVFYDSDDDDTRDSSHQRYAGESFLQAQQRQVIAAAANKERRRRQILPKIAKEDRCGHCHHCRNPKLKKACITARKQQMKSLDDKEELPLFYKIADNKMNSKAVASVRPKASGAVSLKPEVNSLLEEFKALLTSVDGKVLIKPSKHQLFVNFLHRPQLTWYLRIFILNCIPDLPSADKTVLVTLAERKGLHAFQNWLKLASDRTSDAEKFQLDILKALEALPVDMAALRQVPIGKTVNGLAKKDPSQKVKAAAAKVVQQWRQNVGMTDNDAKRARETDSTVQGAPAKKQKQDTGVSVAAAPTVSGRGSSAKLATAGLVAQSSADSAQAGSAAAPTTDNNGVALLHTGSGEGSGGVLPMEVDDDAMFQKKQPKASKADAAQGHKVRRLDVAEVAKLGRDNEQAASSQTTKQEDIKQEDVTEGDVHMEDVKQEEVKQEGVKLEDIKQEGTSQEPGSSKSSKSATGPTAATRARFGSGGSSALGSTRIGAPASLGGSTRIGGLGSIGLGSLGTFSGLNRPTPAVKTAADRAAEAAARIPDPQPGTPRQKKKAVSFVEDGQLACVRYFLKSEPAISVRADPDFTAAHSSDAAALQQSAEEPSEDHPPEFKSAARQEHMDEAAAIRRQMQDGSVGQDELDERNELLDSMAPTQPWAAPGPNPPLPLDADPCAAGEESIERDAEAHRIQMVEPFPPLHMQLAPYQMPQDPFEPAYPEPDQPLDHALAVVILLTPKEIADQQAAQQQQHHIGPRLGFHPDPGANPMPCQLPPGQMPQQGLQGVAATFLQAPGHMQQQPGGSGQYAPPQVPRPPGAPGPYPPLHQGGPPQHLHGSVSIGLGGGLPFRGHPGKTQPPAGPLQHPGPPSMHPLQAPAGGPPQHSMEGANTCREIQVPSAAKPSSALCKYFNTLKGCVRGDSCGFKHFIYEAADAAPGDYRPADSGPPPRRGEPSGRGRGRAFRDGPPHPGRGSHSEGPSWQQSRKCAFFNTAKGCEKGDKCRFAHVSEERWAVSEARGDRGRFSSDRNDRREDRERDRSQTRNDWHAPNRKSSGWDQRPDS